MAREPFNRVWAENPDGTGPNTFQEPSNTRLEKGWVGGASGQPPLAGEENWWHNRVDAAMQQIERYGVMDWHVGAIYGIGGRARGSDGKFYLSLSTPNEANDPTTDDGSNWVEDLGPGQNIAVFDTAGVTNWAVPKVLQEGHRRAHVTVVGAGGAGALNTSNGGGGGGGGGIASGMVDLSGVASIDITVGAGGTGSSTSGADGQAGGSSSFGAEISATGGGGGKGGGLDTASPGVGTGGDWQEDMGAGGMSLRNGGGNAIGGSGGGGTEGGSGSRNATRPGAGGSGAATGAGGNGRDGIVIVRW